MFWKKTRNSRVETYALRLLAHRAIDYFKLENEYFYGSNFDAEDTEIKNKIILETLESLIQLHRQKNNKSALAYNEFLLMKRNDSIDETDYLNFYNKHSNNSFTPYILLEISNFYDSKISSEPSKNYAERKIGQINLYKFSTKSSKIFLRRFGQSSQK